MKKKIIKILDENKDAMPKRIRNHLIQKYKEDQLNKQLIPSLKQMQNFVSQYKVKNYGANSLMSVRKYIKSHLYNDFLDDDDMFFVNVPFEKDKNGRPGLPFIGDGTEENHLQLFCTTKRLLSNLINFPNGPLHLDNTYQLIKNGFPVF
jgi:hypothetical protein